MAFDFISNLIHKCLLDNKNFPKYWSIDKLCKEGSNVGGWFWEAFKGCFKRSEEKIGALIPIKTPLWIYAIVPLNIKIFWGNLS